MKTGIIYEWQNKINGKYYVGQTIHPKKRYNEHVIAKQDSLFHCAIRKYGIENFEYTVVATYEHETEQGLYDLLNEAEKERINFRNSLVPNGYNVAEGGKNGNPYAGLTQEQLEEINAKKRAKISGDNSPAKRPEVRAKISKSVKENCSAKRPEVRAKMSKARKGKWTGENNPMKQPEIIEKRSGDNHHMKRPEVRAKMSGENNPMKRPELRAKMSGGNNPMKRPELRAKLSEYRKGKTCVNNGVKNKWIPKNELDTYLANGWIHKKLLKKSALVNKGIKPVNNGIECKKIHESKIDEFLANNPGWVRGYIKNTKISEKIKGLKPVNNGIECKKIHESKIDEFLANNPGWVRGYIKGGTNKNKGSHRVYHEDGTFHMEKNVA